MIDSKKAPLNASNSLMLLGLEGFSNNATTYPKTTETNGNIYIILFENHD
ncbi:hypothetical protein GCM10007424_01760 [Flavobacterium suaedae]|uniref:Uncharacterized protein n=1 Tax=Flavobacterium suaedae TaxID=1767027 RepID=A0ABQ1JFE1_9FLAO|nr:hypothetical protein GCM10007424_01760 [Flavobacterium suaedae]